MRFLAHNGIVSECLSHTKYKQNTNIFSQGLCCPQQINFLQYNYKKMVWGQE